MMVASSYDYENTVALLERSFLGNIYSRLLVLQFKKMLHSNIESFLGDIELEKYHAAHLLTEYDQVMFKMYGVSSLEEFFGRMRMKSVLPSIKIPMLTMVRIACDNNV